MKGPSPPDQRSGLAKAYSWAVLATGISASMVIPAIVGYLVDQWFGWQGVFVSVGAVVGLVLGIWRLVAMTRPSDES